MDSLELCYDCTDCQKSYRLFHSSNCKNCRESSYLEGCIDCDHCFGCVNLVNQSYCIFNERFPEADYEKELKRLADAGTAGKRFQKLLLELPRKHLHLSGCENVIGDYVVDSKGCHECFDAFTVQDSRYVFNIDSNLKDSMDINNGAEGGLMYEGASVSGHNI